MVRGISGGHEGHHLHPPRRMNVCCKAQKCMRIYQNAYELTSRPPTPRLDSAWSGGQHGQYPFSWVRNSNIMTEAQLEAYRRLRTFHEAAIPSFVRNCGLAFWVSQFASRLLASSAQGSRLPAKKLTGEPAWWMHRGIGAWSTWTSRTLRSNS